MSLCRLLACAALSAPFIVACASLPEPQSPSPPPTPVTDYVTITPDESTSPPRNSPREPEPVSENEDVMASILAIPPGR